MGTYHYKTDAGQVRSKNEDNAFVSENTETGDVLMMVLDGMGGHGNGDKASKMAADVIVDKFLKMKKFHTFGGIKRYFIKAIKKANREINILGTNNIEYHEMGTTLVFAYIHGNKVLMCNVGDSRFYSVTGRSMTQVSEDQTYVQFLYKTGKIKKEDMKIHPKRHILMNALGTYPSISIATKVMKKSMDKILLCSDGLYNMIEDSEINEVLQFDIETNEKVRILIKRANDAGGIDNIAVALWEDKK